MIIIITGLLPQKVLIRYIASRLGARSGGHNALEFQPSASVSASFDFAHESTGESAPFFDRTDAAARASARGGVGTVLSSPSCYDVNAATTTTGGFADSALRQQPTWRRHVYASAWRQLGFDALISDERAEDAAAAAAAVALDTAETPALASPTTRRAICCVKLLLNALDADDDDESESIRQRRRSDRGVARGTQSALDHLILGGRHTTQMERQNQTQEQQDSFLAIYSGGAAGGRVGSIGRALRVEIRGYSSWINAALSRILVNDLALGEHVRTLRAVLMCTHANLLSDFVDWVTRAMSWKSMSSGRNVVVALGKGGEARHQIADQMVTSAAAQSAGNVPSFGEFNEYSDDASGGEGMFCIGELSHALRLSLMRSTSRFKRQGDDRLQAQFLFHVMV